MLRMLVDDDPDIRGRGSLIIGFFSDFKHIPEKARCIVLDLLEFGCKVDIKEWLVENRFMDLDVGAVKLSENGLFECEDRNLYRERGRIFLN
jgi:hypothetical protein